MQRERQAAAVRKCKANAAARAANGEGAKVARRIKDYNAVTEGEIHRVCAKAVGIDENQSIMIPVSLSVHLHLSVSSSLAFSLPQSCL